MKITDLLNVKSINDTTRITPCLFTQNGADVFTDEQYDDIFRRHDYRNNDVYWCQNNCRMSVVNGVFETFLVTGIYNDIQIMKSIVFVLYKVLQSISIGQPVYFNEFIKHTDQVDFRVLQFFENNIFREHYNWINSNIVGLQDRYQKIEFFFKNGTQYIRMWIDSLEDIHDIQAAFYMYISLIIGFGKMDSTMITNILNGRTVVGEREKLLLLSKGSTRQYIYSKFIVPLRGIRLLVFTSPETYDERGRNLDELGLARVDLKDISSQVINNNKYNTKPQYPFRKLARDNIYTNPKVTNSPYGDHSDKHGLLASGLSGSAGFPFIEALTFCNDMSFQECCLYVLAIIMAMNLDSGHNMQEVLCSLNIILLVFQIEISTETIENMKILFEHIASIDSSTVPISFTPDFDIVKNIAEKKYPIMGFEEQTIDYVNESVLLYTKLHYILKKNGTNTDPALNYDVFLSIAESQIYGLKTQYKKAVHMTRTYLSKYCTYAEDLRDNVNLRRFFP